MDQKSSRHRLGERAGEHRCRAPAEHLGPRQPGRLPRSSRGHRQGHRRGLHHVQDGLPAVGAGLPRVGTAWQDFEELIDDLYFPADAVVGDVSLDGVVSNLFGEESD